MQEFFSQILSFFGSPSSLTPDVIFSLDFLLKGGVFYLLVIWLACVIWVIKDITNRSDSLLLQVVSILLVTGLTPIFGLPIYLLIRPSTTLFERYYEETSLLALEENEEKLVPVDIGTNSTSCHSCGKIVSTNDTYCPHCGAELLDSCKKCGAKLQPDWKFCNGCGKRRGVEAPKEDTPKITKLKEEKSKVITEKSDDSLETKDSSISEE